MRRRKSQLRKRPLRGAPTPKFPFPPSGSRRGIFAFLECVTQVPLSKAATRPSTAAPGGASAQAGAPHSKAQHPEQGQKSQPARLTPLGGKAPSRSILSAAKDRPPQHPEISDQNAAHSIQHPKAYPLAGDNTTRKPKLSSKKDGRYQSRKAARAFLRSSYHEPPRSTWRISSPALRSSRPSVGS